MAERSGQTESNIRKVVRAAIAQRIFEEPRPGVIIHSAVSRLLAENPDVHDYVATVSDELWPAAAQTCNAWAKYLGSEEPNETVIAVFVGLSRYTRRIIIHTLTCIGVLAGK